jgi:biopolymer transport protein ExbB
LLAGGLQAEEGKESAAPAPWWNVEWSVRKHITVDAGEGGVSIADPVGTSAVLVRLHEGNFNFAGAREDGSDLRFVSEDGKTVLKHHVEKFDSVLYEAFVWVQVPEIKGGAKGQFWLYYGNTAGNAPRIDDSKGTYDADTALVYHFPPSSAAPSDASGNGNNASTPGTATTGAQIGAGLRLTGQNTVSIPASPSLAWAAGSTLTWSAWVKATTLQPAAVIFSRHEGANSFIIGVDNGVPYVEVSGTRSPAGAAIAAGSWKHLAVTASSSQILLYLDGEQSAALNASVPALNSPLLIGKDTAGADAVGFAGELDELQISKTTRSAGFIKFAAVSQGSGEKPAKLLNVGQDEAAGEAHAGGELEEHMTLIKDISKSLTFDGWVVIFLCALLALIGGWVSVFKLLYLNRISKATHVFIKKWEDLSADLTVLDHGDEENINSMGGQASPKAQKQMNLSPLYHIYKIGSTEIQHRLSKAEDGFMALSGRSVQAIKATLDGGREREVQKLNSNLVFLTIGIAGGPYLGLLGTVIGVMITFAVIAKSGEVEVNSIAPGIAGALLATVAGLAVAIPALFAYSYISTRIKDAVSDMEVFIDEFVARIAEVYPESYEAESAGAGH